MKNARQERFGRMQRQDQRTTPLGVSHEGFYTEHSFEETEPDSLSKWVDVSFVLNKRQVFVAWEHPRQIYLDEIGARATQEAGDDPKDNWLGEDATVHYKKVGASRKKIAWVTTRKPSAEQNQYYERLFETEARLKTEGIDFDVPASWERQRLPWTTCITLVAPLEVRNMTELATVVLLARRLILGQTMLEAEFPGYRYTRADWLQEQERTE